MKQESGRSLINLKDLKRLNDQAGGLASGQKGPGFQASFEPQGPVKGLRVCRV